MKFVVRKKYFGKFNLFQFEKDDDKVFIKNMPPQDDLPPDSKVYIYKTGFLGAWYVSQALGDNKGWLKNALCKDETCPTK